MASSQASDGGQPVPRARGAGGRGRGRARGALFQAPASGREAAPGASATAAGPRSPKRPPQTGGDEAAGAGAEQREREAEAAAAGAEQREREAEAAAAGAEQREREAEAAAAGAEQRGDQATAAGTASWPPLARTRVIAGLGALGSLGSQLEGLRARRPVVICDRGVIEAGGAVDVLGAIGSGAVLRAADPDPAPEDAEEAAAAAADAGCDSVVAVGGGSGLGLGKAVALLLANKGGIRTLAGFDQAARPPVPCVSIPTTGGSGSEVSGVIVLHDECRPLVTVLRGAGYEPAVAILDGRLLRTLPSDAMLYAGLDALSHAIEALWARAAAPPTDSLAAHAVRLITAHLPRALDTRPDDALQALLEAGALANLACGATGLTLPHALASATGIRIPHGRQTGVLLPHVAAFNAPALAGPAQAAADSIETLYRSLGFEARFELGELDPPRSQRMRDAGTTSPLAANNPRPADARAVATILAGAGAPAPPT